jgi:hypothetical protein
MPMAKPSCVIRIVGGYCAMFEGGQTHNYHGNMDAVTVLRASVKQRTERAVPAAVYEEYFREVQGTAQFEEDRVLAATPQQRAHFGKALISAAVSLRDTDLPSLLASASWHATRVAPAASAAPPHTWKNCAACSAQFPEALRLLSKRARPSKVHPGGRAEGAQQRACADVACI